MWPNRVYGTLTTQSREGYLERTLLLIKPDAIERGLIGEIVSRVERKGLKLVGLKMLRLEGALLDQHYSHLAQQPFFPEVREFMQTQPVIAICVEGLDAVEVLRRLVGTTLSREATIGTIRGDLGMSVQCNLVHASDSPASALVEIERFFESGELYSYARHLDQVIYAKKERG